MTAKVKSCRLDGGDGPLTGLKFWCPGCNEAHVVRVSEGGWTWDGNENAPTITPSVKCEHDELTSEGEAMIERGEPANIPIVVAGVTKMKYPTTPYVCHSTITTGMITFCPDCTHALVNQTVALPDWPL